MQQDVKRGSWDEQCSKCKYYDDSSKRCTKLDIKVGKKDWCKEYVDKNRDQ